MADQAKGTIKRIQKGDRVIYYNVETKRFASAKDWVRENYDVIGTGKKDFLDYTTDLTEKERRSFVGQRTARSKYRYKGQFLDKNTGAVLKKLKIKPNEVEKRISPQYLEVIQSNAQLFTHETFIKDNAEYKTTKGDLMSTADMLLKAIAKGEDVTVEFEGEKYEGKDAIVFMREFEDVKTPDREKYRITHKIAHDPKTGKYFIKLDDSEVEELGDYARSKA